MNKLLLASFLLVAPPILFAAGPSGVNSSSITFIKGDEVSGPNHICKGKIETSQILKGIGLSPGALKNGTPCVAGDFDGNGFIDFAFLKEIGNEEYTHNYKAVVIFYGDKGIIHTSSLKVSGHLILTCPKCDQEKSRDGIAQYGSGDMAHTLFFDKAEDTWITKSTLME